MSIPSANKPSPRSRFGSIARIVCAFLVALVVLLAVAWGIQQIYNSRTESTPKMTTQGFYTNPVIQSDFPDPSILQVGNLFYAYATNAFGKHVQVARSDDLVRWEPLPDAMPALPAWVDLSNSNVWAAEVIQIGNTFVMYYTARDQESQRQCVGVAASARPDRGFRDTSSRPLICQIEQGGTIDSSPFRDGDKLYLYFKNDGNCCGLPTHLYVQELAPDGLSLVGNPVPLLVNDQQWEGNVIEAPNMFKHNGTYYLFYSANDYGGASYAIGYARCQTPLGPCVKAPENPILASRLHLSPPVIGPGGQNVFQVGNQTWIAYHAWNTTDDGLQGDSRFMWLDRINWQHDRPVIQGPTTEPQPTP